MAIKIKAPAKGNMEEIRQLIGKFSCLEPDECDEIRSILIGVGAPALGLLEEAFTRSEGDAKIQIAKTLGGMGSQEAVQFLINKMESDDFDERYAAIQGLPLAGKKAINPLLHALVEHSDIIAFRNGAHTVLHNISATGSYKFLKPVLMALEGPQSDITTPVAAHNVLEKSAPG